MNDVTTSPTRAAPPAQAPNPPAPEAGAGQYLTLRLGAEEYGIDILRVQEIRSYDAPTRIASAPEFLKGVVNLRGVIVPIIDLRVKFGLSEVEYTSFTVVIVLNIARRVVGVVVDAVSDVIQVDADQLRAAPEFSSKVNASFITALAALRSGDEERLVILTDIERLLSGADTCLID